jgi:TRAP-type mannitol/chloroaromatic compound transport system permease small subunit
MMKAADMFCRWIDLLSEATASLAIYLVVLLTAVLGWEVVARYLFSSPTKWSYDLSYMIGGTFFLLGEAYTLKKGRQVRIDIFYSRFVPRVKALIDVLFYGLFFLPLWTGMVVYLVPYVYFSFQLQERSMQGYWQPIIYPFKAIMLIGVCLLLLQGLAEFIRQLNTVIKGK